MPRFFLCVSLKPGQKVLDVEPYVLIDMKSVELAVCVPSVVGVIIKKEDLLGRYAAARVGREEFVNESIENQSNARVQQELPFTSSM